MTQPASADNPGAASHGIIGKFLHLASAQTIRDVLHTVFFIYLARVNQSHYGEFQLAFQTAMIVLFLGEFGLNQPMVVALSRKWGDKGQVLAQYGLIKTALFLAGMASEDRPVPTRIMRLDGLTRDVEMQVHRAREIANDATVVTCRDISKEGKLAGQAYETDSRFHMLVDGSMNLVCHVIGGGIRYVNQAGLKLLGAAEPEEVLGRRLEEIFHPDYADLLGSEMIEAAIAEDTSVPLRLARRDGKHFDAVVKLVRLPSRNGDQLMVEARDITAHNKAVMALRRANETLEMRVVNRTRELAEQRAKAEEMRQIAEEAQRFGLAPYEVSNYAQPGAESRHNLAYWRYGDYLGIGPGAHQRVLRAEGMIATRRHRAPEEWAARVEQHGHAAVEETTLTPEERGREAMLMGLRLSEGVDPARIAALDINAVGAGGGSPVSTPFSRWSASRIFAASPAGR